jgi:uncharacterized RDD family membrane protein YckC
MEKNHLIDDLQPELIHASTAKRFLNFVIDTVGYYVSSFIFGGILVIVSPNFFVQAAEENSAMNEFLWLFLGLATYFLYYFLFEFATGGRTLGKLITGTKAVYTDGTRIGFSTSFKRNAIRLIPFEIFSYFGSPCEPWHDRWVDTMVMDIKQSNLNAF